MPIDSSYLMLLYFQHKKQARQKFTISPSRRKDSNLSRATTVDIQVPKPENAVIL